MAEKYFLRSANVDTTCDLSLTINADLDKTQGADTTVSASINSNTFADHFSFDVDASGDNPVASLMDLSIQVDAAVDLDWRARIQDVDDAGCAEGTALVGSIFQDAGTGVKTDDFGAANKSWNLSSERLRLIIEIRRTAAVAHGSKTLTINVSHNDSHLTAQSFGPTPQTITPAARLVRFREEPTGPTIQTKLTITPPEVKLPFSSGGIPAPTIHVTKTPGVINARWRIRVDTFAPTILKTLTIAPTFIAQPRATFKVTDFDPTIVKTLTLLMTNPQFEGGRQFPIVIPIPTINVTKTPDAQSMPLVMPNVIGIVKTLVIAPGPPSIDNMRFSLQLPAPTINLTGGVTKTPDAVTIPLVLTAPTLNVVKTPIPILMGLNGQSQDIAAILKTLTITPDALAMPVTFPAPTLLHTLTITPDAQTLPVALTAPTINVTKTPIFVQAGFVIPLPTILRTLTLTPDALAMPIAFPAPTVALSLFVTPASGTVPMLLTAPTINFVKTPSALPMPILIPAPTVLAPTIVYTTRGGFFLYEAAQWSVGTIFKIESTFRSSTGGDVAVRLRDFTLGAPVAGSAIVINAGTQDRHRSGAITLVDGNEYQMQTGVDSGETGQMLCFSLIGLKPL